MRKILFVSLESPWPPNRGGRQRTNLLYRALRQSGEVDLLLISDNPFTDMELSVMKNDFGLLTRIVPTPRGALGPWRWLRKWQPKLIDRLAHNLGHRSVAYAPDPAVHQWITEQVKLDRYDLLVARYTFALTRSGLTGRLPTILDVDDLITSIYRYRMQVPNLPAWQRRVLHMHLQQHERYLPRVYAHCQRLWVANPDDVDQCDTTGNQRDRIRVLPNIPWTPDSSRADDDRITPENPREDHPSSGRYAAARQRETPSKESHTLLTVGSLNYGANLYGVSMFVDQAWPLIRAAVPDAEFVIVGNGMTSTMREHWQNVPGVRPIGLVDDVGPWYAKSAFAVAPVFYGGGTNIKVLEAFQHHRTCVVTAQAHRGYTEHLRHQESLFVGATLDELARGCVQLLQSPTTAQQWAQRGHQIVARQFSWDRFQTIVTDTVREVCPA